MMNGVRLAVAVAGALTLSGLVSSQAGAKDGCGLYAERAVAQYREMLRTPSCRVRKDARWHDNLVIHLAWCERTKPSNPNGNWNAVWQEDTARENWLTQCTRRGQ